MSALCKVGLHRFGKHKPTGYPPMFVMWTCRRRGCAAPTIAANFLMPWETNR